MLKQHCCVHFVVHIVVKHTLTGSCMFSGSSNLQLVIACVTTETGVYVPFCYSSCLGIRKSLLNFQMHLCDVDGLLGCVLFT